MQMNLRTIPRENLTRAPCRPAGVYPSHPKIKTTIKATQSIEPVEAHTEDEHINQHYKTTHGKWLAFVFGDVPM